MKLSPSLLGRILFVAAGASTAFAQTPYQSSSDFEKYARMLREKALLKIEPRVLIPTANRPLSRSKYPWKNNIVTTVFWVGESAGQNNPVHNHSSSWDLNWGRASAVSTIRIRGARRGYIPANFVPRQNPFYVALPYNDVTRGTTKPESRICIPWFKDEFVKEGQSVCRDRWIRIRNRNGKDCYAQWSDCGPFRTDHWQYVFGDERPKPNLNKGAGLDVSPAVRDFLGLGRHRRHGLAIRGVQGRPRGPWSQYGENNHFVQAGRRTPNRTASLEPELPRRDPKSAEPSVVTNAPGKARTPRRPRRHSALDFPASGPCIVRGNMAFTADEALDLLRKAHAQDRLAHAYLITGPVGSGKRQLAGQLAALILGDPRRIRWQSPDVHVVEPESKSRRILIEQIRELERELQMRSFFGGRKVGIIFDADRLNANAANAFLKTLEEPPGHSHLLLLSAHPDQLLETILSRCLEIPLRPTEPRAASPLQQRLIETLRSFATRDRADLVARVQPRPRVPAMPRHCEGEHHGAGRGRLQKARSSTTSRRPTPAPGSTTARTTTRPSSKRATRASAPRSSKRSSNGGPTSCASSTSAPALDLPEFAADTAALAARSHRATPPQERRPRRIARKPRPSRRPGAARHRVRVPEGLRVEIRAQREFRPPLGTAAFQFRILPP